MGKIRDWMDATFYRNFKDNWDDHLFRTRILNNINSDSVVLDLGAGAGLVTQMNFRGHVSQICGVDLDPRVLENPTLNEGRISDAGKIPYDDRSFDVVFANNVMEHLDKPLAVYREISRVLKPGGILLFKTPNKWHYVPIIARVTPHVFHEFVNRLRGRSEVDTFPTRYLSNSLRQVMTIAKDAGLVVNSIERIEGRPEYCRMAAPLYVVGLIYERLVNLSDLFAPLRVLLVVSLAKPKSKE